MLSIYKRRRNQSRTLYIHEKFSSPKMSILIRLWQALGAPVPVSGRE
jgi:hypothetical protein